MTRPTDITDPDDIGYIVPPEYRGDEYLAYRAGYKAGRDSKNPELAALLRELAPYADEICLDYGHQGEYDKANAANNSARRARAAADRLQEQP
jgi:hypothetical protein